MNYDRFIERVRKVYPEKEKREEGEHNKKRKRLKNEKRIK